MTDTIHAPRLEALRRAMGALDLAGYLVPKADEFQLEYVPPCNDRLAWLTGFTGSAGLAVAGRQRACLFTDSRYTEQARAQTDPATWENRSLVDARESYFAEAFGPGDNIGYDPRLHTPDSLRWLRHASERAGFALVAVRSNLIDPLWTDRPQAPRTPLHPHPVSVAGESSDSKRKRMAASIRKDGATGLVITDPANWAWLLNLRAQDLEHTPLALGYCLLEQDSTVHVFVAPSQWTKDSWDAVVSASSAPTHRHPLEDFETALSTCKGRRVRVAQNSATQWVIDSLRAGGASVDVGLDPCDLAKACKTPEELQAIEMAHVHDGIALVQFLHWLSETAPGELDEWSTAQKLFEFRSGAEGFKSLSFRIISAFGPSGALPHYTVERSTARKLELGSLYLVDSGTQYVEGTTDVTRVAAIGSPTKEMQARYTQTLRGHIALARAKFPQGITGQQLDPLARQFLWAEGVDYGHGTGHGVGCYLSVHEGPQSISPRPNRTALAPGMIVSNEPGYYKSNHFGIRIENLMAVTPVQPQPPGAETQVLGFKQLTLCPYERELIDVAALCEQEQQWVDEYHRTVADTLRALLPATTAQWLTERCAPLRRGAKH